MILICAKEDDAHTVKVASILKGRYSEEIFIFDTSTFPTSASLTGSFGNGAMDLLLAQDGRRIHLQDIKSFWWRRPQPMAIDPRIEDQNARSFAFQECVSALYGILECCETLWVNDMHCDTAAEYKALQLKVAKEEGFHIPETLITNSPEELLKFWEQHNREVIYKAFNQRALVWRPTRVLREEDLAMLHTLRHAPVIFQSLVPGIRDVRVTVIGERIFATEFDIEQLGDVDYRMRMMEIPCRTHDLPPELETKILSFMSTLGLEFGGIDFRVTPDGEYIFFEINPDGEFMYLEDRTGQPLAEAMATHLSAGKPSRPKRKPVR